MNAYELGIEFYNNKISGKSKEFYQNPFDPDNYDYMLFIEGFQYQKNKCDNSV